MQGSGDHAGPAPRPLDDVSAARPTGQPILHTARLTLVPLADEHLALEVELDADPEVMRYLTGRGLDRAEAEQAHAKRIAAGQKVPGLGFWVGFDRDEFIGWWLLQPPRGADQPYGAGQADLGYRLLRRHWRRGYASEGARELIRYGFDEVGLHRIFAQTLAANVGSRATLEAVGLTFVRAFVSADPNPVESNDEVEYAITRHT